MRFNYLLASAALIGLLAGAGPARSQALRGQSPIDIRPEDTRFETLPPLQFRFNQETDLQLFNSGSPDPDANIRAILPSGSGTLILGAKAYDFQQFHFHVGGEHEINGQLGDVELHRVFRAADGELAVVGQIGYLGEASPKFATFFDNLSPVVESTTTVQGFDLAQELPDDLRSFRYEGSLTTFAFNGGVLWNLLVDPFTVSAEQVEALRAIFPEGNAREVQDIDGRIVLTDVAGFNAQTSFRPVTATTAATAVPEPASLTLFGLAGLGMILARRRSQAGAATAG